MDTIINNIHHVGYLVKNIDDAIGDFEILGFSIEKKTFWDEDRKADICFLTSHGTRIELVSPQKESSLYPLLKKYKNMPYHICYEVDSLEDSVPIFQEKGFFLFLDEARALAISTSAKVVFLMSSSIGMIELVEL